MRGHIKKCVETARLRRIRRKRRLRVPKPKKYKITPRKRIHRIRYISSRLSIMFGGYVRRVKNLFFFNKINIRYNIYNYKFWSFFYNKALFDLNRYFFFKKKHAIKNSRNVHFKWIANRQKYRQGGDFDRYERGFTKLSSFFKYFSFKHFLKDNTWTFFLVKKINFTKSIFKTSKIQFIFVKNYMSMLLRRIDYFKRNLIFLRIFYKKLFKFLGGIRKRNNFLCSRKQQNHFTKRVLKYKLFNLYSKIKIWKKIINITLIKKTNIKFSFNQNSLTFSPKFKQPMNYYTCIWKSLMAENFWKKYLTMNISIKYTATIIPQVISNIVFFNDTNLYELKQTYLNYLNKFNIEVKKQFNYKKIKHEFKFFAPTTIKFKNNFYFDLTDNLIFINNNLILFYTRNQNKIKKSIISIIKIIKLLNFNKKLN